MVRAAGRLSVRFVAAVRHGRRLRRFAPRPPPAALRQPLRQAIPIRRHLRRPGRPQDQHPAPPLSAFLLLEEIGHDQLPPCHRLARIRRSARVAPSLERPIITRLRLTVSFGVHLLIVIQILVEIAPDFAMLPYLLNFDLNFLKIRAVSCHVATLNKIPIFV